MKTTTSSLRMFAAAAAVALFWSAPVTASAQNIYVSSFNNGTSEFDSTGAMVPGFSVSFGITGLAYSNGVLYAGNQSQGTSFGFDATTGNPATGFTQSVPGAYAMAVGGGILYVGSGGSVGTYDAVTGAALNANYITGLGSTFGMTLSGNTLYVSTGSSGSVLAYDVSTNTAVPLGGFTTITTAYDASGMAVANGVLYLANYASGGGVSTYNAATGAVINDTNFITGLSYPEGLAISGNDLYVVQNDSSDSVSEYDTSGNLIKPDFITGMPNAQFIAVTPTPEPGTWVFLASGLALFGGMRRRGRVSPKM